VTWSHSWKSRLVEQELKSSGSGGGGIYRNYTQYRNYVGYLCLLLCVGPSANRGQSTCVYFCKSWMQEVGHMWSGSGAACSRWNSDRCPWQPVSVPQHRQRSEHRWSSRYVGWPVACLVSRKSSGWDQVVAACLMCKQWKHLCLERSFFLWQAVSVISAAFLAMASLLLDVGRCNKLVNVNFVAISFSYREQTCWWWWSWLVCG